jgi:hypothetical protein
MALVDIDFAKDQVELLLDPRYFHPGGQIPAYEWNFEDVNPPVQAWPHWSASIRRRVSGGRQTWRSCTGSSTSSSSISPGG